MNWILVGREKVSEPDEQEERKRAEGLCISGSGEEDDEKRTAEDGRREKNRGRHSPKVRSSWRASIL
jgi:hypothetical protein